MDDRVLYVSWTKNSYEENINGVEIPYVVSLTEKPHEKSKIWDHNDISFSTIGADEQIYHKEIKLSKEAKKIHFLIYEESKPACYHENTIIFISEDMEDILQTVRDIFSCEHNAENECEKCNCILCDGEFCVCLKQTLDELEKDGISDAESSYHEGVLFKIYNISSDF